MAAKDIQHRRKVRQLETKRDTLLEQAAKQKTELAAVRATLKQVRKAK